MTTAATTSSGIDKFITALSKSARRGSLFSVIISGPTFGASDSATSQFEYVCRASNLPSPRLGEIPVPYFGRNVYFPGEISFDTWTTTIINNENYVVRNAIERWMDQINSNKDNRRRAGEISADSMYGTGYIKLYDIGEANTASASVTTTETTTLENIYPLTLNDIPLAYSSSSQIQDFEVTWQINYMSIT